MLEQGGPDAKVAGHRAQGDIGDGPQHQIATKAIPVDADIPADAAGGAQAVPFGGNGAGLVAIGEHELGIVAAVAQGALQIEGNILAQGGATPSWVMVRAEVSLVPLPIFRLLAVISGTTA